MLDFFSASYDVSSIGDRIIFISSNKYIYIILFYVFHGVSASHNGLG